MRNTVIASIALLLILLSPPLALPHHSAAAMDFGNTITVEGVVELIRVVNPHTKLVLRVSDEDGERDIEYEAHSRNNIYRGGYRDGMIKVGDSITVTVAPMRDGSEGG